LCSRPAAKAPRLEEQWSNVICFKYGSGRGADRNCDRARQLLDLKRIKQLTRRTDHRPRHPRTNCCWRKKFPRIPKPGGMGGTGLSTGGAPESLRDLGILPCKPPCGNHPKTTSRQYSIDHTGTHSKSASPPERNDIVFHALPTATASAILSDNEHEDYPEPGSARDRRPNRQTEDWRSHTCRTGSLFRQASWTRRVNRGRIRPAGHTQFTYLMLGGISTYASRTPNRDVSLKLKVEVSAHTNDVSIGRGLRMPVISQRYGEMTSF